MQWLNKVDDALDRVFLRPGGGGAVTNDNENPANGNPKLNHGQSDGRLGGTVPPPPPPPPAAAGGGHGATNTAATMTYYEPSTPITAAAAGEFLTDNDRSSNDGQIRSEEKLHNLAQMMKRLERDAREAGSGEATDSRRQLLDNNSVDAKLLNNSVDAIHDRREVASHETNMDAIPLLPLSSAVHDGNRQIGEVRQRNELQMNQKEHVMQVQRSYSRPPPPPPPPTYSHQTTHPHQTLNQQCPTTPRTPQHVIHLTQPQPSPLATPRITPSAKHHPTPGIIRAKIRSPSVSDDDDGSLPPYDDVARKESHADRKSSPPFQPTDRHHDPANLIQQPTNRNAKQQNYNSTMMQSHGSLDVNSQPVATGGTITNAKMMQQPVTVSGTSDAGQPQGKVAQYNDSMKKQGMSDAAVKAAAAAHQLPMASLPTAAAASTSQSYGVDLTNESNSDQVEIQASTDERAKEIHNWFGSRSVDDANATKDQSENIEDVENDDSSSTTFHSQISNRSDLTSDDNDSSDESTQQMRDFQIPPPPPPPSTPWSPSYNVYGIVHIKLLRAQRLPCQPGTTVVASLALPPWKGRIRIDSKLSIDGPDGAGVCLRWDNNKRKTIDVEEIQSYSMVHAYNNVDTPIPVVMLTLSASSMGGVFEKFLCSVAFSCEEIMKCPGVWISRWYVGTLEVVDSAALVKREQSFGELNLDEDEDDNPMVLMEACFEPKVDESLMISEEDSDTLGPIPRDLVIRRSSPEHRLRHMPETVYSSIEDDSVSKTSSLTSALVRHPSKTHLLRVRSFWTPAWCSVCSKVITSGWLQGSFECEACHIFCCKDCRLQVDVSIPCGSELSKIAVRKARQYQVSIGQVMTTLAPYSGREMSEGNVDGNTRDDKVLAPAVSNADAITKIEGIGVLSIRVLNACLFDKTYPPDAEPNDVFKIESNNLRHGDHYVRISWLGSKDSKRTKTVLQTAKPVFDSDEMIFDVAHYGMEYKLEVVDANTDKAVGSCLLSAQGLLQMQRDNLLAHWDQLILSILHLRDESEPRRMKMELRSTVKDGFGLNFYNSTKIPDDSKERSSSSALAGEISGWIEFDVNFREDTSGLFYATSPRQCPPRATEEFDIAMINLHIARISALIEDIQNIVSVYTYLVSWENYYLTGFSLAIFIITTLRFNLEYLGALPVGMLVLYMLYLGHVRISGHFKDRWITKEKKALVESESKIEQHYTIHRPIGLLQVGNLRGRNLRSRDLGLPGSFYVSISFDPLRYASEKKKKSISKLDASSGCSHQIGNTISPGITSSPVWTNVRESSELSRLKHLLPDDHVWGKEPPSSNKSLIQYPILQPITKERSLYINKHEDGQNNAEIGLLPWDSSVGAVVLQVRFSEVLGSFQLFENVLGEVVLPLAKLAGGQEVEGWFRLLGAGTTETLPGHSADEDVMADQKPRTYTDDSEIMAEEQNIAVPELYVKVKFTTPSDSSGSTTLETETSRVICEEMVRTASLSKEGNIGVMIGSSINTINTVRTLGGTLQNQISNVVNIMEMVRNAFNFSSPRITCFLLVCLSILWVILASVPTRIVVLVAGLGQYSATYYSKFIFVPKAPKSDLSADEDETDAIASGNIVENLFLSIPTDEDMRRAYFWEARRVGERERENFAKTKRQTRLKKLWKASWHGTVKVKEKRTDSSSSQHKRTWSWDTIFVLIEGHRFIWWRSEKHFDTGEAPLGQIFFAGHSGLAGLSPLDLRELSKEEIPFVVSVFGRGTKTQQKLTLLAPSVEVKDDLENAVLTASSDKKAD